MDKKGVKDLEREYDEGISAYTLKEKLQVNASFIQMKAELVLKFEGTGYKDDDDRREVWRKLQTVAWLEQCLNNIVDNGKIAEVELKGFAKLKQVLTR
jgi:hypothetical protein